MKSIEFEYVQYQVCGTNVTFVLDKNNHDWYFETVRTKKPFSNPIQHHLIKIQELSEYPDIKYADFGANIGVTSLFAANMGISTLAVEAGVKNFILLSEASSTNNLKELFRPVYQAASAHRDVAMFSENSAWGSISRKDTGTSLIPTDNIFNILQVQGFTDAHAIKVDIEGAELDAFTEFENILETRDSLPDLIVESNDTASHRSGYSSQELWSRIISIGYDVYLIEGKTLMPVTKNCLQPSPVMDFLATTRSGDELSRDFEYKIVEYKHQNTIDKLNALLESHSEKKGIEDFFERQIQFYNTQVDSKKHTQSV